MGEDHHVIHGVKHLYEHVELFGPGAKAKELSDIIKQHALAATGIAFIPVPILDVVAVMANIWTMYARINEAVGISFGENILKSIASGVAANVAAAIPALVLSSIAGSLLKFIPGLGTAGGIAIEAASNIAILYVAGKVYIKALEVVLHSGQPLTEDSVKKAAEDVGKDKSYIKTAYAEGKDIAKDAQS